MQGCNVSFARPDHKAGSILDVANPSEKGGQPSIIYYGQPTEGRIGILRGTWLPDQLPMLQTNWINKEHKPFLLNTDHLQQIPKSCISFWISTSDTRSHISEYSDKTATEGVPCISWTQQCPISASWAVRLLARRLGTRAKRCGEDQQMTSLQPSILPEKGVTTIIHHRDYSGGEESLNTRMNLYSEPGPRFIRLGFMHRQSHRIRRAQPFKSRTPRPPSSMDRQTFGHAIKQWPPLASFLPLHKKSLLIFNCFNHRG